MDLCWKQKKEYLYEAPVEDWSEQEWLILEIRTSQRSISMADFHFFRHGEGEPAFSLSQKFQPNLKVCLGFPLSCLDGRSEFLPPMPGQLKSVVKGEPTSIREMDRVTVEFRTMDGLKSVEWFRSCVTGHPAFSVEAKTLVDEMGQYAAKDWPGKFHSPEELTEYLKQRRKNAVNAYPEGFSRWGGWLEKSFDRTGYFHTAYDGRRWWLVDPDGYAFLSNGACYGARYGIYSHVTGQETLCAWLPDRSDPLYAGAYMRCSDDPEYVKRNGKGSGTDRWMFSFTRANMMRAFGEDWKNAWAEMNGALYKNWGFNTLGVGVGNYSDEDTYAYIQKVQIPFVLSLTVFPKPEHCLFRDFPDVFDPEYERLSAEYAKQLLPYRDEPLLIGYFLTNEPEWLFQPVSLSKIMLSEHTAPYSCERFLAWIREKYGSVEKLNAAWKVSFDDFGDLKRKVPKKWLDSEAAADDLSAFDSILIERYARIPSEALRKSAPHHLNLGMRYSHFEQRASAGFSKYDVFSFNCYGRSCNQKADDASEISHLPLMIGEWHFCGYDRGLHCSGLVQSHSQEDRARSIVHYIEQGFAHPSVVGMHYFEFFDQPLLGRFDGASGQSGLIDVCNQPYPEVDAALRNTASRFYRIADGQIPPTDEEGVIDPVSDRRY